MTGSDWTVLLIGGGPCTGKTTLARALGKYFDVPVVEGDLFRSILRDPLLREADTALNTYYEPGFWQRPLDQLVDGARRLSRRLCTLSESIVARQASTFPPMIIEAVWVLPEFATKETYSGVSMAGQVRSLFVYEPDVDVLRQRLLDSGDPGWSRLREEGRAPRVAMFHAKGLEVKSQAQPLGLPVLECRPFETLLDRALAALGSRHGS